MDPVTTSIVSAITAGVVAGAGDAGKKLIVDAYTALKEAIQAKLGTDSDTVEALEKVEKKPESKARQDVLAEEITAPGLDNDPDLLKLAQTLAEALKSAGGDTFTATADKGGIVQRGSGNVASTGGGITVGGDVKGGIHMGGKKEK